MSYANSKSSALIGLASRVMRVSSASASGKRRVELSLRGTLGLSVCAVSEQAAAWRGIGSASR